MSFLFLVIARVAIVLKFDIFELMFNEILVIDMHNSQLVYNFYEQAIKLFL